MDHKNKYLVGIALVLLAGIAAIPLMTQATFRSVDQEGKHIFPLNDMHDEVRNHQADGGDWRLQRRLYSRAILAYQRLMDQGVEGLVKPDINDMDSMMWYIEPEETQEQAASVKKEETHAAPAESVWKDIYDLPEKERHLVRWYGRNLGYCPETLRDSTLEGFYELCQSLVEMTKRAAPPVRQGLLSDKAYLRSVLLGDRKDEQNTLKLRMKMIEEAITGSAGRRTSPAPLTTK